MPPGSVLEGGAAVANVHRNAAYLLDELRVARHRVSRRIGDLTEAQAAFRPDDASWSVTQVVEHLVWTEHTGLHRMVRAIRAHRAGEPLWTGENPNRGETIEDIVAATWRERETALPEDEPTWGGPLAYWAVVFEAAQDVTERVAADVRTDELDEVVIPHELSGPLSLRQRLAFLRFHLERHEGQLERIVEHEAFPAADGAMAG